jgi:NDP-sugar pyrophosphorylase family protein
MKTVIMAGDKGTRIAAIADAIPKPMIPLGGKTVLEHQIDCLHKNGLKDILIITGHLGDAIKSYFKDGSVFGVRIAYYTEKEPLGTAGALFRRMDALIVNAGIHILTKELLIAASKNIGTEKADLDRDVLKPFITTNRIYAYTTPEYIKDMGTPDRFYQVEKDIKSGRVRAGNLAINSARFFWTGMAR